LIEFAQDVTRCLATKYASGPVTPAVRRPARARVHRVCRGTCAPGDVGCMGKGRQTQNALTQSCQTLTATAIPSPNVGCRCHSTRTRSACSPVSM
jgi:hypothetical protein